MSDSAGAGSTASAASTTGAGQGSNTASSTQSTGGESSSNSKTLSTSESQASAREKSTASVEKTQNSEASTADDFEELKIGQIKAKVPKAVAEAVKNLERGFQTKAQKAAQAEKLLQLAQENPKEFYKRTGKDPYAFAEQWLAEKYEEMSMPQEVKDLRDTKAELEKYKSAESQSKKQLVDQLKQLGDHIPENIEQYSKEEIAEYVQHRKQEYQREADSLDHEIGKAFQESGLPPDKYTLAKVAFELATAARQKKQLSAKDALAKVVAGYDEGTRERFGKMDGKRIHELLGEDVLEKIRKYDLEKLTQRDASKIGQQHNGSGSTTASQGTPKKYLNELEWRKAIENS
jgi:hypothetical protein